MPDSSSRFLVDTQKLQLEFDECFTLFTAQPSESMKKAREDRAQAAVARTVLNEEHKENIAQLEHRDNKQLIAEGWMVVRNYRTEQRVHQVHQVLLGIWEQ